MTTKTSDIRIYKVRIRTCSLLLHAAMKVVIVERPEFDIAFEIIKARVEKVIKRGEK